MKNFLPDTAALLQAFEQVAEPVCMIGRDGFIQHANQALIQRLGYPASELLERPMGAFIHPDDREPTRLWRARILKGQMVNRFRNRFQRKDGNLVWLEWSSLLIPDRSCIFASARDVSELIRVEEAFEHRFNRVRNMALNFKAAMENDRAQVASELHEEIAQLASVIKMDVDLIHQSLAELPETVRARLDNALLVCNLLVETIRRLSFSISPAMLGDLGLNDALQWHCQEFTRLTNIACYFESDCEDHELTLELRTDLFRICQESLYNVMMHAGAGVVRVSLEEHDDRLELSVFDDGIGFDMEGVERLSGIQQMRERAYSVNGQLLIHSAPGEGTSVTISVRR